MVLECTGQVSGLCLMVMMPCATCDNCQLFTCVDVQKENLAIVVSKRAKTKSIVTLHTIGNAMAV